MKSGNNSKLTNAMAQIERAFGKDSIASNTSTKALSTGSVTLNAAIGVGGWPRGSVVEIYGPSDVGKTTMLIATVIEAQKKGLSCAWIDTDKKFLIPYAESLGVDPEGLLLLDPNNGEEALDMVNTLIANDIDLIVVDSLAALVPRADLEVSVGDEIAGVQARMVTSALNKIINLIHEKESILAFTNQIRYRPPQFDGDVSRIVTPGGGALASYAKVRVELKRENEDTEGTGDHRTLFRLVTNAVGPKNSGVLNLNYENGVNRVKDLIELTLQKGILSKNGEAFQMDGRDVARNLEDLLTKITNPELDLKRNIIKALRKANIAYSPLLS